MNTDSIIFDLDGTLWISTEVVIKAWNHVLNEHKEVQQKISKADIEGVMGLQIKEIGKKLFPDLNEEMQSKLLKNCCDLECQYLSKYGGQLYDNLEKTLIELSTKYKLFIVSNCQCGYIEAFFSAHKLDKYFLDFENPGRTNLSKGENIKLIIERNNLKNPVYIGDTEGDLKAARFADIPFIYAKYGFGEVSEYDYAIDAFEDILQIF